MRASQTDRRLKGLYWDKAWSLIVSCSERSPGCDNCWSREMRNRFKPKSNQGKWQEPVVFREDNLLIPAHTKKKTVFAVWNDLFHKVITYENILSAFTVMSYHPHHTYVVLTKRPERIKGVVDKIISENTDKFLDTVIMKGVDNNIWLGTSVSVPKEIPRVETFLENTEGYKFKRVLSIEPCLDYFPNSFFKEYGPKFDLIIIGCESGTKRRIPDNSWVYSPVKICRIENVNLFVKQWDFTGKKVEKLPYGFGAWCSKLPWNKEE